MFQILAHAKYTYFNERLQYSFTKKIYDINKYNIYKYINIFNLIIAFIFVKIVNYMTDLK